MRARQLFLESLLAHDVTMFFGNPGSTENAVVDGLFEFDALRYILALHEGVAVGAATFYAQASGKTPMVNLHAGPGLGNGIGMIYGALRANVPMIVTAGQQDTRMRMREPVLSHDLAAMAAPVGTSAPPTEPLGWRAPAARQVQLPSSRVLVSSISIRGMGRNASRPSR